MTTTTPPETQVLTVEEALKELREMFPRRWIEIAVGTSMDGLYYKVRVYGMRRLPAMKLSDAMDQVRQWRESQQP